MKLIALNSIIAKIKYAGDRHPDSVETVAGQGNHQLVWAMPHNSVGLAYWIGQGLALGSLEVEGVAGRHRAQKEGPLVQDGGGDFLGSCPEVKVAVQVVLQVVGGARIALCLVEGVAHDSASGDWDWDLWRLGQKWEDAVAASRQLSRFHRPKDSKQHKVRPTQHSPRYPHPRSAILPSPLEFYQR